MRRLLYTTLVATLSVSWTVPAIAGEPTLDVTAVHERQYFGEPIDLSLRDADLVETLRTFAISPEPRRGGSV